MRSSNPPHSPGPASGLPRQTHHRRRTGGSGVTGPARIGINGFGRMGRLALRAGWDRRRPRVRPHQRAQRRRRRRRRTCSSSTRCTAAGRERSRQPTTTIAIDGHGSAGRRESSPGDVAWGDLGVDIVLECSGKFRTARRSRRTSSAACARSIVAAPVKDGSALNVVIGVNDDLYDPGRARHRHRRVLHHELPRAGGEGASTRASASRTGRSRRCTTSPTRRRWSTHRTRICAARARRARR